MSKDLITVIVPVYNVSKYIDKCLKSLINQTYTNLQIILVNDGSTDNSGEICDRYSKEDKRIEVFHKKNEGVSLARTYGYQRAKGSYIAFVDSDDWIESYMIECLYKSLIRDNTDLSICNFYYDYKNKTMPKRQLFYSDQILSQSELFSFALNPVYVGGFIFNKLFKKEILDTIMNRGFLFYPNYYYCEDLVFTCEYITLIESATYVQKSLYHYRQRDGSATRDNSFNYKILSLCNAYENIIEIYSQYRKDLLPKIKYNYLKINLNIRYRIISSRIGMEYLLLVKKNINKYYSYIICKSNLSILQKMNIILSFYFPKLTGRIKEKIKKYKKIG